MENISPKQEVSRVVNSSIDLFANSNNFEHAQRVAAALVKSDLVPKEFRNNISNAMIALNMANRMKADPLAVMQNLYIVHGKPSWSSSFMISAINASGKFSALRFVIDGTGDEKGCICWATDSTGERLESPKVTIAMAKAEGWFQKAGSKWKTMPDLMMRYRSASFFGRLYAPEITNGFQTQEEIIDIQHEEITPASTTKSIAESIKSVTKKTVKIPITKEVKAEPVDESTGEITENKLFDAEKE